MDKLSSRLSPFVNTDLHVRLVRELSTLLERIEGTEGRWQMHWQRELEATKAAIAALSKE